MTQLGQAATSHSWQRAVRPGRSSVTPPSHVVDIAASSCVRVPLPVISSVRSARQQINVIVFISEINYFYLRVLFRNRAFMEIPQIEAFLALGPFGGFRRAAAALRLTQPAVSARIRALEDSLSVRLFERGRRGHGLALSAGGPRRPAPPPRIGETTA